VLKPPARRIKPPQAHSARICRCIVSFRSRVAGCSQPCLPWWVHGSTPSGVPIRQRSSRAHSGSLSVLSKRATGAAHTTRMGARGFRLSSPNEHVSCQYQFKDLEQSKNMRIVPTRSPPIQIQARFRSSASLSYIIPRVAMLHIPFG
jgi:hypothetical protein